MVRLIQKRENIEKALGVTLQPGVIGIELTPDGGAIVIAEDNVKLPSLDEETAAKISVCPTALVIDKRRGDFRSVSLPAALVDEAERIGKELGYWPTKTDFIREAVIKAVANWKVNDTANPGN